MKFVNGYCAFCKNSLKIFPYKRLAWQHVVLLLPFSLVTGYVLKGDFDLRTLILFFVFLFAAELMIQFRWRTSIQCKRCGFDPVLYLKDNAEAAKRVKNFLEIQRMENPLFRDPFLTRRKWREIEDSGVPLVDRRSLFHSSELRANDELSNRVVASANAKIQVPKTSSALKSSSAIVGGRAVAKEDVKLKAKQLLTESKGDSPTMLQ